MNRALLVLLAACNSTVGTLSVSLTTAPGSTVLDGASSLELILTNPHTVATAQRDSKGGFTIELDLPSSTASGSLIVDALDSSGALVATGSSPSFPLGAIDATVVIYMAAPNTIGAAPVMLTPARSELGAATLSYGAIFAGGRDATGTTLDAVTIYNTYDHALVDRLALPAPRSGLAVGIGANDVAYMFGGSDMTGQPTASLWRCDTAAAPDGVYSDFGDKTGFARTGQLELPLGNDNFLVTGTPAADLAGPVGTLAARTDVSALPAAGASVLASDSTVTTIVAGPSGILRFRSDAFDTIAPTDQTGASVAALPGGRVLVACGASAASVIDAASGSVQAVALPMTPKPSCGLAATSRHLLVVGGADAELYDATTLAYIATLPLVVPRTGAIAIALPNDQILIAGGVDASSAPIDTLELFTPEPVE